MNYEIFKKIAEFNLRVNIELEEEQESGRICDREIGELQEKIERIREECEVVRRGNEEMVKTVELEKIQKEIREIGERITETELEVSMLTEKIRNELGREEYYQVEKQRVELIEEKYELMLKLQETTDDLEELLIENSEIETTIQGLNKPACSEIQKYGSNTESLKENFKKLCTETAMCTFDTAISITDLENLIIFLKREIEHIKLRLKGKDSEHEHLSKQLTLLQSANTAAVTLINKDSQETHENCSEDLQKLSTHYDILLNELDFLSNLTLLQTKTWMNKGVLEQSLKDRLEDLSYYST